MRARTLILILAGLVAAQGTVGVGLAGAWRVSARARGDSGGVVGQGRAARSRANNARANALNPLVLHQKKNKSKTRSRGRPRPG